MRIATSVLGRPSANSTKSCARKHFWVSFNDPFYTNAQTTTLDAHRTLLSSPSP